MISQLDRIVAHARPDWYDAAACRTPRARRLVAAGRADFFPDVGRSAGVAREICADCPVRPQCLERALGEGRWLRGIYGGTTQAQRRRILDQREAA